MLGMRDTINPEGKTTGAYYYEGETLKDAYSTNVLGYECWQGDKCEWLEGVTLNKEKADGRWSIETPGRAPREVQGIAAFAEYWPANMVFGRHMDLIVARGGGSETSHYCDWQNVSSSTRRVVYRSNNNANANGGVSYANTNNDSSNTNANIGSRLANNEENARMHVGLLHRERVPTAAPRGRSLASSGLWPERRNIQRWVELGRFPQGFSKRSGPQN